jgi:hypothetical protein
MKVTPPQLLVGALKLPPMPTMNMTKYMADPQAQAAMQKMGD